jgi:hypothetical protein
MDEKKYLDTKELATRWKKSPSTLANQRGKNEGPPHYKIGGKVLYALDDIVKIEEKSYNANE